MFDRKKWWKEYYLKNKGRIIENQKKYYLENKEHIAKYSNNIAKI